MDNEHQQEGDIIRFLVMPFDILGLKDLKPSEKLVFARIAGFRRFFESSQATADFLGLSKLVVERAKRNLVKLGYVVEIADTGRGKIYRAADTYSILDNIDREQGRPAKKVRPDMTKKSDQTCQKSQTENKYRINKEYKGDETVADESPKQYGREDINEIVDLWESETGISIKGQQNQRRQVYNLIRRHGYEATKALVLLVGESRRVHDQFAPQIATPSDLTGKYSKLERLRLWDERRKDGRTNGSQQTAIMPPTFNAEEWDRKYQISDQERAEVSQRFKEARKTLPFLKKGGDQ